MITGETVHRSIHVVYTTSIPALRLSEVAASTRQADESDMREKENTVGYPQTQPDRLKEADEEHLSPS